MSNGQELTAVELQFRFLENARAFAEHHGFDGSVPRSDEILALWATQLPCPSGRGLACLSHELFEAPPNELNGEQIRHLLAYARHPGRPLPSGGD